MGRSNPEQNCKKLDYDNLFKTAWELRNPNASESEKTARRRMSQAAEDLLTPQARQLQDIEVAFLRERHEQSVEHRRLLETPVVSFAAKVLEAMEADQTQAPTSSPEKTNTLGFFTLSDC